MAKGDFLGEFEYLVMLAMIRLSDKAYGMTIRQDIEERTQRPIAVGAVYACLERMEGKGYIESREGETTRGRGSLSKTYYQVTALGKKVTQRTHGIFEKMEEGIQFEPSRPVGKR